MRTVDAGWPGAGALAGRWIGGRGRHGLLRVCALLMALSLLSPAGAQPGPPPDPTAVSMDAARSSEVVLALATVLRERFAYRDRGIAAAREIEALERRGVFRGARTAAELLSLIDQHVAPIVDDRHFRARYLGPEIVAGFRDAPPSTAEVAAFHEEVRLRGGEVPEARWLAGNVGYLRITRFLDTPPSSEKLSAALSLLADTSALIVDVRGAPGGEPAGVAKVIGHFVARPTPTVRVEGGSEPGAERTYHAEPRTPSFAGKPLFVLVDAGTGSGAEEFAYNLQAMGRATLVGETTAGAATPGGYRPLAHGFVAFIPMQIVVNTLTGTHWEGVGVIPEVKVPGAEALSRAHRLALDAVLKDAEGVRRAIAEEGLAELPPPAAP
jgi:hypothetical protein